MALPNPIYTDEQLMDLLKINEGKALQLIFNKYHGYLCASAFRIVQDKELAKDLVQDVFIRFWNNKARLLNNTLLKAYLKKSVINAALTQLEKSSRLERTSLESAEGVWDTNSTTDHQLNIQDLEVAISQAIDQLPIGCRTVFVLSRYEELSNADIAEHLKVSVKAVEKQMSKALKRLREVVVSHSQ